jgi:hypothetical protein
MTVYVPGEPLHDRVDVSEPPIERLFVEKEQEMPLADVAESLTVAEKPYSLWRVTVELPEAFPALLMPVGFALSSKSGMWAFPQTLLSTMPIAKSNSRIPGVVVRIEELISMRKPEDSSNAKPRDCEYVIPS